MNFELHVAVADLATVFGDGLTANMVGPQLTCTEADALALVLSAGGHSAEAASWLVGHAIGQDSDENSSDSHWPIVLAAYALPVETQEIPTGKVPDHPRAHRAAMAYLEEYLKGDPA